MDFSILIQMEKKWRNRGNGEKAQCSNVNKSMKATKEEASMFLGEGEGATDIKVLPAVATLKLAKGTTG